MRAAGGLSMARCYHGDVNRSPTDEALVEAWRSGDREAAGALMSRHFASVYRFFASKVAESAVEDLTQRVFLGCLEAKQRFRPERGPSFRAYLLGIARKQLLQYFDECTRDGRRFELANTPPESLRSPSRAVADGEGQKLLLQGLKRLPMDFQITIELFFWEELPIADIAKVLDVAPGTVKSRLHRAKRLLEEEIGKMDASPELIRTTITNIESWARSLRSAYEKR